MVLSITLFLTVSFHSSPYYTGADIVFVFAWIPLVLAGSGGVLSLDGVIAARVAGEYHLGPQTVVPIRFALVQEVCGHYENDFCRAQGGRRCNVHGCPFLTADGAGRLSMTPQRGLDAVDRRTVVIGGATAVAAAAAGAVVAGTAAGLGRAVGGAKSPGSQSVTLRPRPGVSSASGSVPTTTTPESSAPTTTAPLGTPIGSASEVPVGGAGRFTDPKTGDPGLVLQLAKGQFVAYDAICPHAGCTVGYSSAANLIVCPCHGSEFDPSTGAVVSPPAPHGLSSIQVTVDANGELVVDG